MNWWRQLRFRLVGFFRKKRPEAEVAKEMGAHLELEEAANRAAGMEPAAARYAARRQFGDVEQRDQADAPSVIKITGSLPTLIRSRPEFWSGRFFVRSAGSPATML